MAELGKLKNIKSLLRKLEKLWRISQRQNNGNVIVGYNARYALAIHENIEMKWKGLPRDHAKWPSRGGKKKKRGDLKQPRPKGFYWDPQGRGQAKFLEQPAREKQREMRNIIVQCMQKGTSLLKALMDAGRFLQAESQRLVPVDSTNLRGSAFTEQE